MKNFINQIKPLFPVTYNEAVVTKLLAALKIELKNPKAWVPMAIQIVIYLLIDFVAGIVLGLVGWLLLLFAGVVGTLVGLYTLCGIILSVLDYLKVFEPKDQE